MEADNSPGITTTTMDNTGIDLISELQDDLLHRILYLLDMKQVVQTSILSRRWRYLWISMPSFNFNQEVFKSCPTVNSNSYRFVKFVDKVLQSKTSIEKFVLSCDSDYFVGNEQVYKWIVDAVRLKVSVLELLIKYGFGGKIRSMALPLCLFTYKTLTTLKLDLENGNNTLVSSLPDSVCLTGLKTLHLSSLDLVADESTDAFFSRCPVLETLVICKCKFIEDYKNNALPSSIFSCKMLVSLKLDMYWLSKDHAVFSSILDSVNLPSLKSLHLVHLHLFSRESTVDHFFSSCSSLKVLILKQSKLHINSDALPRCVFTCKTLVNLSVDGWSKKTILRIPDLVSLPCLEVFSLNSICLFSEGFTDNFFSSCPVLETLIISYCSFTPSHFFCKSLTTLVLYAEPTLPRISLCCPMSFPALKDLHLDSFLLDNEDLITDFLASCPELESLAICAIHRFNLYISALKLRQLTLVRDSGGAYVSDYALRDYEVKLNAPNLTSFVCLDDMADVYILENLSSIVKVDFEMKVVGAQCAYLYLPEGKKQRYARQMMKILGVLYNVKDLTLSSWFLEVVFGALDLPDNPSIEFFNLRCLKLETWRTMDCARIVMYLLEHSPNIESLSVEFDEIPISLQFFKKNFAAVEYWEERLLLQCMLHHLKSVELKYFSGGYPEFKFVEFLLKNAINLQELIISFITMLNDPSEKLKSINNSMELKGFGEKLKTLPSILPRIGIFLLKMEPSASKKSKTTVDDGGDRISELSDDVLQVILSFLDMKQVVTTSILSRRWRYLWISMRSLNFNQYEFSCSKRMISSHYYRFGNFVDMVLQSKTNIDKLLLTCDNHFLVNGQVFRWIVDAVRLNVSVLDLNITDFVMISMFRLPSCVFTCKTLTTLKLDFNNLHNTLDLGFPDSVRLTSLKTLHLSSHCLIGEESTEAFFSGCPVLETLIIRNCKFIKPYKNNYLPSSIFSCETLVCLELDMSLMDVRRPVFNNIPDSINLPSLKSLYLGHIHLFSGESTNNIFFSSCPVLETLILRQCMFYKSSNILPFSLFTCKTLVKLDLEGWSTMFNVPDLVSLPCLKTLRLKSLRFHEGEITGNFFSRCPVLETLIICMCSLRVPLARKRQTHLLDAFHNFSTDQGYCKILVTDTKNSLQTVCTWLDVMIQSNRKSFPFWKKVHLQNDIRNEISRPASCRWTELVCDIPAGEMGSLLSNISFLKLMASFSEDLGGIIGLLNKCANLEALALKIGTNEVCFYSPKEMKECWKGGLELECLLFHLKSVEMLGTVGCGNELDFLAALLKKAQSLQTLKIVFHPQSLTGMRDDFIEKLLIFPRLSSSSTIIYETLKYGRRNCHCLLLVF